MAALLGRLLPGAAGLRHYHLRWLRPDLMAGLAVWAVLVPQGLAYGELAGLSPVAELYTALGALLLYGLVGSSRRLHVGPESSVSIITAAYVGGSWRARRSAQPGWPRCSPSSRPGSCSSAQRCGSASSPGCSPLPCSPAT